MEHLIRQQRHYMPRTSFRGRFYRQDELAIARSADKRDRRAPAGFWAPDTGQPRGLPPHAQCIRSIKIGRPTENICAVDLYGMRSTELHANHQLKSEARGANNQREQSGGQGTKHPSMSNRPLSAVDGIQGVTTKSQATQDIIDICTLIHTMALAFG